MVIELPPERLDDYQVEFYELGYDLATKDFKKRDAKTLDLPRRPDKQSVEDESAEWCSRKLREMGGSWSWHVKTFSKQKGVMAAWIKPNIVNETSSAVNLEELDDTLLGKRLHEGCVDAVVEKYQKSASKRFSLF